MFSFRSLFSSRSLWVLPLAGLSGVAAADTSADEFPSVTVLGQLESKLPSQPLVNQGSPQSVVSEETLHEIASPVGDFGTAANFTPSFVSTAPNGPGFDAAKNQSLRGFTDGQFNVTMDGIPFGDPDNFQHHSTSYFPTAMLQQVVIDRSPGGAPDLGYASFGGSVNLYSQTIPDEMRARVYASYGSFNTALGGATFNTAAPHESGQTGVLATLQYAQSDGALSESAGYKDDLFLKSVTLLGTVKVTAAYTYDRYRFYNPGSITTTELADIGSSYGYNNNPASPDYYRYSYAERSADFGYVKAEGSFSDHWRFEDKVYTFSYQNTSDGLTGDQTSSAIGKGFTGIAPSDIGGRVTVEDYRTAGNDVRVAYADSYGAFLAGIWVEHSWQNESRFAQDFTTGQLYDANKAAQNPIYFDFNAHLNTIQPYAEYAWQATDALNVRFGVRYRDVTRDLDASVIQNFKPGPNGTVSRTVVATLPSVDANYRLTDNTHLLAQVSRGSLVPSQAFFYTSNPAAGNQTNAETATAYQLGITHETSRYGVSLYAYDINFDNYISTVVENGNTLYVNSGAVRYRGLETEDHIAIAGGLSAVGNASLLRATFQQADMTSSIQQAGNTIPFAPRYTALAGLVYRQGPWSASLLSKFVGTEYQGKNGSADSATYRVSAYSYTNATATRNFVGLPGFENLRVTFGVNNLFNSHAITDNAGPSIVGPNLVNVLPRFNYMLSAVADF